jgi:excinuclease ABC subunit A
MHFLPDVWVTCEACGGTRYTAETLAVTYRGRSIADVLEMKVDAALELFAGVPKIRRILQTLHDVGLGYVSLGQAAPTMSGGEAQRVKLAAELARPDTGRTLYILDEPTTGLHMDDVRKLLDVIHRLADLGNTVVVIEHNLDVIKTADWVLDLGPEAGAAGGRIVAEGTPEVIAASRESLTGAILKEVLDAGPLAERARFDPKAAAKALIEEARKAARSEPGDDVRMPWQVDGRRWHCADRVTRTGKPVRWDGRIVELVADCLASHEGLPEPDWSSRSLVRIAAPSGDRQAFAELFTGFEWTVTLKFRVPSGGYSGDGLTRELGLTPFAEYPTPVLSDSPRVSVTRRGGVSEVVVVAHSFEELDTAAFRAFLGRLAADVTGSSGASRGSGVGMKVRGMAEIEEAMRQLAQEPGSRAKSGRAALDEASAGMRRGRKGGSR